jgi:hypothetical protein
MDGRETLRWLIRPNSGGNKVGFPFAAGVERYGISTAVARLLDNEDGTAFFGFVEASALPTSACPSREPWAQPALTELPKKYTPYQPYHCKRCKRSENSRIVLLLRVLGPVAQLDRAAVS